MSLICGCLVFLFRKVYRFISTKYCLANRLRLSLTLSQFGGDLDWCTDSLSSFVNGKASSGEMNGCAKMPPPPPPPPLLLNGPPPPPPMGGLPVARPVVKKDVPPSSVPLKCFNWTKIPDAKVGGTIWTELDEAKLYKVIDLGEFDKLFSAYQKNGNGLHHVSFLSILNNRLLIGSPMKIFSTLRKVSTNFEKKNV